MNGRELPDSHGFPLRAGIPGHYGMKQPKWLTEIEVVAHDYQGYWEERGWADEAVWTLWVAMLVLPSSGESVLAVRVTDGQGTLQDARGSEPLPDGASGYHKLRVKGQET